MRVPAKIFEIPAKSVCTFVLCQAIPLMVHAVTRLNTTAGRSMFILDRWTYVGCTDLEVSELPPPARRLRSCAPSGVGIWNGTALQRGHMGSLCTNWLSVASGRLLRNSHSSMHARWKQCRQGRSLSSSPRVYATKQIEHSSSRNLSELMSLACSAGRLTCTRGSACSSMAAVAP